MFQYVSDDACVELEDELEIITQHGIKGMLLRSSPAAELEPRSKSKLPPEPSNAQLDFFGRALLTLSRPAPEW